MEKQIITFSANEQTLTKTGGVDCYASNTVAYIEAHFDLGTNWSGYDSVRAVWFTDFVSGISTVLDSDGVCIVPYEVLTRKGEVTINLVGSISNGEELTDRLTTCPVVALTIKCNAQAVGTETAAVTPSQFEQFVDIVKADADRAETVRDEAEAARDVAVSAKDTAVNAVEGFEDIVDTATATAVQTIQGEGATQVTAIQTEGTTQVASVRTEGSTQVTAVQDKGDEVLDSIPADYTQLSQNVTDLKSDIDEIGVWVKQKQVAQGVDIWAQAKLIDCNIPQGAKFTIEIRDTNVPTVISKFKYYFNGSVVGNFRYVNTVYEEIANSNITSITIYVQGTHAVGTGTVTAVVKILNDDILELEDNVSSLLTTVPPIDKLIKRSETAHNMTDVTKTNERFGVGDKYFYKCDLLAGKTADSSFSGFQIIINSPPVEEDITVTAVRTGGTGRTIRIDLRDNDGNRIGDELWTTGDTLTRRITKATNMVEITLAANWNASLEIGSSVSFNNILVETKNEIDSIIGSGANTYTGEPIVLSNDSIRVNKCSIVPWKDFKSADIPNIVDYRFDLNQSMTLFGGYVFLFQEDYDAVILDYSTKEIVDTISPIPQYSHFNSAQFTNYYYTDEDFPLLLLSRCNGGVGDECNVIRIVKNGNDFSTSHVTNIISDIVTNNADWAIDNVTNELYMCCKEDNLLKFFIWDMPTLQEIITSAGTITLKRASAKAICSIPYGTFQGMCVNGGVCYIGITSTHQYVYAVSVYRNRVLSKIQLTDSKEVEGVAIYDGSIFVSQKNGYDTSGTNPMCIYSIEFHN